MLNKIQFLFLICALPVLLLPFGPRGAPHRGFWDEPRRAWPALALAAAAALLAVYLAKDIVMFAIVDHAAPQPFICRRSGSALPLYWPAIAVWLGLGMAAYAVIWKVPALEALATTLAVIAGCMVALLALDLRYNPNDVVVVFHPFEQMFTWASGVDAATREQAVRSSMLTG